MDKQRSLSQRIGFCCGLSALVTYAGWNLWWLAQGSIPPSMLLELADIPAPTTGMTRSWMYLAAGETAQAFLWNPLTIPVTLLYLASLAWLGGSVGLRKQGPRLPALMIKAWAILLPTAWCIKLLQGPAWW